MISLFIMLFFALYLYFERLMAVSAASKIDTNFMMQIKDHISNGRIYIQDEMHRIVCYNMQGEVLFLIDSRGSGPHEYAGINAFAIDVNRKELVIYDNLKLSLMYYSSENGECKNARNRQG
jgi:hypothetical protein